MDGIHDLGGRHGFGGSLAVRDEEIFHEDWERRVSAMAGMYLVNRYASVDAFRHAIERLDPVAYLSEGYYGRWLGAIELLLADAGGRPTPRERGASGARRTLEHPPRFSVGERVVTRNVHPAGHTRLPGYARARSGTILLEHGSWVLPDTNAHGLGECPEYCYAVRFEGEDLWGDSAEPRTSVTIDLFESYLEPA